MKQFTREEVLTEAKSLAAMIAKTDEIERFKQIEAMINDNQKVQRLIKRIKTLQKSAVNLQAYEKKAALEKVEAEIERAQTELDNIPIVQEFKEIQAIVNDVLQLVSGTIAREITNNVIKDTDGDLLTGETGSKANTKTPCSN